MTNNRKGGNKPEIAATLVDANPNAVTVQLVLTRGIAGQLVLPFECVEGTRHEDAWNEAGHAVAGAIRDCFAEVLAP